MPQGARAEIVRRFRNVDKDPSSPLFRRQLGRFKGVGETTWTSLLPAPRAAPAIHGLVLEAASGTGKTTEVEAQAERLQAEGLTAFFCQAKRVASSGLATALDEQLGAFRKWQASGDTAVMFVDAVDEVYLDRRSASDLFRELEKEIDFVVAEIVLIVTVRTGMWGEHEATFLRKSLGLKDTRSRNNSSRPQQGASGRGRHSVASVPTHSQPWEPNIQHVTFEPLDTEDIRGLAQFYGAKNPDRFTEAFEEAEVANFMDARPRDLELFVQYWNLHKQLGSWTEVAAWFVNWTYPELNVERRNRALTLVEYADGLKRVAAASILTKQLHIILPNAPSLPGATHAAELFPEWPPAKLQELFNSPLFVPKTASAVQLPQGAVAQCLAALWFGLRYRAEGDLDAIVRSVFAEVPGRPGLHLADSRRPIAGWLATTLVDFRKPLSRVAPDVLLHFGDPAKLESREIQAAIRKLVEQRAIRHWEWPTHATLARLARPEIEETFVELVNAEQDPDMLWHLFRFVEAGRYTKCVPRARQLALDEDKAGQAHSLVVRVVQKLGTVSDKQALRALLNTTRLETRAALVSALVPDLLTGPELAALLVGGCNYSVATAFASKCGDLSTEQLDVVLDAIDQKTNAAPERHGRCAPRSVSQDSESALVHVACSALLKRLARPLPSRLPRYLQRLPVSIQLVAENDYVDRDVILEFNASLQGHTKVRRAIWRTKLQLLRQRQYFQDHDGTTVAPLAPEDFGWLYGEANRPANAAIRHTITCLLTDAYRKLDANQRSAARGRSSGELHQLLQNADEWSTEAEAKAKRREASDAKSAAAQRRKNRKEVVPLRARIRAGTHTNSLLWAWQHLRSNHTERARVTTAGLAELVGADLAEDFLTGFAAMWRTYPATAPVAGSNSVKHMTLMALTGVTVDYQRGLDLASLTVAEATNAALLGMHELNGFPSWMGTLVQAQPAPVRATLLETVTAEWDYQAEHAGALRFAPYEGEQIQSLFRSVVSELAEQRAPAHFKTVHYAVSALLTDPDAAIEGAGLAARMTTTSMSQVDFCAEWLRLWAHAQPLAAATWINSLANTSPDLQRTLVLRLAAALGQDFDRDGGRVASTFFSPEAVRAWMPILIEAVKPGHDVSHEGVHVVGDRDNAQELRNKCLSALQQDGSPQSYGLLKELHRRHKATPYGTTLGFALAAQEKSAAEQASEPWTLESILDFERSRNPVPTTIAGLFNLVRRHLRQIGESQENGDFSHRELFAAGGTGAKSVQTKELSIQRWVAATLQLAARGIYSVERETETLNRNKVDICARVPGLDRLPIEIKPIGSYSEKDLKETIRDQLLGKYMLPREVSHGILLLVQLSQRKHAVAKQRMASFADLCTALIRYAGGFAVSDGKVIDVVSISLAEPRQRRSRKRRAPKQQRKRGQGASARQPKPVPRPRKRKRS